MICLSRILLDSLGWLTEYTLIESTYIEKGAVRFHLTDYRGLNVNVS